MNFLATTILRIRPVKSMSNNLLQVRRLQPLYGLALLGSAILR